MTKAPLTLGEIRSNLEELFVSTKDLTSEERYAVDVRIAAAHACAEIADVILGIHAFFADLEDLDGPDPEDDGPDGSDGPDPRPSSPEDDWERLAPVTEAVGSEGTDLSGAEEGSDHDDGFPSEPE